MQENIINSDGENDEIEIIDSDHLAMAAEGDYIGLPFEHIEQSVENNSGLSKFSSKYIREPLPSPDKDGNLYDINPINKLKVKNVYKFGFVLLDHKDYKWKNNNNIQGGELGESVEINFINTDNKTSDDSKFMMDGAATIIKHESQYQLTEDRKDYTFVSKSGNFATLTDDYTNEIFTNIPIDRPRLSDEYGTSMSNLINAVQSIVNNKQKNPDSTYAGALKYVIKNKSNKKEFPKSDQYWGQSYGNGSMFRSVITGIVAQDYEQGLELTKLMVKNTHDDGESLTGARAVFTVIFLACCGLRAETIRKVIHFMFFNPNPPKDSFGNAVNLCNYDMLSHRKNINQDDPEAVRRCDREQLEKDIKAYKYSEQTSVTATLGIRIALTAESTEEAKRWGLEAGGDCDTLLFLIMAMKVYLNGSIKSDVEKMKSIFLETRYNKGKMCAQIEKEKDDPNTIKRIDENKNFVYYTELNEKFNEMFKHHTRAGSKVQRQLLNIYKFMNHLFSENKDWLLNEIFKDIRSDIDFMLDAKTKYKMDKIDSGEIEKMKQEQAKIRSLSKEQTDKIMNGMEQNKEIHDQEIKKLKDEYNIKMLMHKNATARFQNKIKEDKLKNLTAEDIQNINTEVDKINDFFSTHGVDKIPIDNYNLKTKDSLNQIFIDENENSITYINYGTNTLDKKQMTNQIQPNNYNLKTKDSSNQIFTGENENSITYINYGTNTLDKKQMTSNSNKINNFNKPSDNSISGQKDNLNSNTKTKIDNNNSTLNPYLKYFIGGLIWLIISAISFLLFYAEIISLAAAIIITVATLILDLVLMFIISCYTKNQNDNLIKTKKFSNENEIVKEIKETQEVDQDKTNDMKEK